MNLLTWVIIGGTVGALCLATQWWTVKQLSPSQPYQALGLTLGGATFRWIVVAGLFLATVPAGPWSLAAVFVGQWLMRWAGLVWLQRGVAL